jgi:hypothetical protein
MTQIEENQELINHEEWDGSEWDQLIADLEKQRDEINRIIG